MKNQLEKVFDFYIFSNIHVALASFSLVKITLLEIGISENNTAWFVFFSTFIAYNFIRFSRLNQIKSWTNKWIVANKKSLVILCFISLIPLSYLLFQLRLKAILVLFPFSLLTFLYVSPIKKIALRNMAGLKLFLIAFSWAGITVIFPLIQNYMSIHASDWISFLQRFLFIIIITLPFDIRDVSYDHSYLKTIPQQIGLTNTKITGTLLAMLFFFLEFFKREINATTLLTTLIVTTISSLALIAAKENQKKYYSAFLVESIPIIWWFCYFI